jgi:hypothetical protein
MEFHNRIKISDKGKASQSRKPFLSQKDNHSFHLFIFFLKLKAAAAKSTWIPLSKRLL